MKPIDLMITDVIRREGGYIDHPADKGGPTKYGITHKTLTAWRGRAVGADDVRALKEDEARAIYRTLYFTQPGFERLPSLIQPQMFDIAVNSGPGRAVRLLQHTLNTRGFGPLAEDGRRGPLTDAAALSACRALGGARLNNALLEARLAFYRALVAADPTQQVFLRGWVKRAEEFREAM